MKNKRVTGKILSFIIAAFMSVALMMPQCFVFAGNETALPSAGQGSGYIPFTGKYISGGKVYVKDLQTTGGTTESKESKESKEPSGSTDSSESSNKIGIKQEESGQPSVNSSSDSTGSSGNTVTGQTAGSMPQYYRSDRQAWAQSVKVKDQKQSSLCWAFSMTTAAEYSYAKELYEKTKKAASVEELAPGHTGQFYYNRVNDPLNNTAGDFNGLPANQAWALYGGNAVFGMQSWASWSGAAPEIKYPFSMVNDRITSVTVDGRKDYAWTGAAKVYPDSGAYKDALVQQESVVLFTPDRNRMKKMITEYGAISASVCFDIYSYMNLNYDGVYYKDPVTGEEYLGGNSFYDYDFGKYYQGANHAVTIVGWDDNYPKERFTHVVDWELEAVKEVAKKEGWTDEQLEEVLREVAEEDLEKTTPSANGAWIVQNSWGDEVHDKGFYYMSYESSDFNQGVADFYAFDMQPADTYKYNFQYDGNAISSDASDIYEETGEHLDYYTVKGSRAANVYKNTTGRPIKLEAVGYTTFLDADQEFEVSVYTGLSGSKDPTKGRRRLKTKVRTSSMGCKTAVLDKPVYIAPGDKWSIVFTFKQDSSFGTETSASSQYFTFNAKIDPGQSFFSAPGSGKWSDMNNYNACFRIKGFANPVKIRKTSGASYSNADEVTPSNDLPEGDLEPKPGTNPETKPDSAPVSDMPEENNTGKWLIAAAVVAVLALALIYAAIIRPRLAGAGIRRHKK